MTTPTRLQIWVALVTIYIVWGSTYLAIRYALGADTGQGGLPPFFMGGARFLIAGVLMLAWSARRPAPDGRPDPIGLRQWLSTAIVGLCLIGGGNGMVVLAENRGLDSSVAAVLVATSPLWIAVMAVAFQGDHLPRRAVVGLALGFAGVVILANPVGSQIDTPGAFMIIAGTLAWAAGSVYSRGATVPRRPLVMTGMEMVTGGAFLLLVSLVSGELFDLGLADVGWYAWTAFAYLIVIGAIVAFTAYVWLLRAAPMSLVTTYAFVNPIVAVGLGALPPLREELTARTLLASTVIVLGVAVIVRSRTSAAPGGDESGPTVNTPVAAEALPADTTSVRPPAASR